MKHLRLLAAVLLAVASLAAHATVAAPEALRYQIVYHWGLIWKHAGDATLTLNRTGEGYEAQLTGTTRSWADKVYRVRDTLRTTMDTQMRPLRYDKLTHEKNYHAHDIVRFSGGGSQTSAVCRRVREGRDDQFITLSTRGQAYDMVSVFYMLRNLDYNTLVTNKSVSTVIFSGKQKENLTISYKGVETIQLRDGSKHTAHRVTFRFTQDGGRKSSDNISAWLSTDPAHIPLLIVGKLPVGEVKCYYTK